MSAPRFPPVFRFKRYKAVWTIGYSVGLDLFSPSGGAKVVNFWISLLYSRRSETSIAESGGLITIALWYADLRQVLCCFPMAQVLLPRYPRLVTSLFQSHIRKRYVDQHRQDMRYAVPPLSNSWFAYSEALGSECVALAVQWEGVTLMKWLQGTTLRFFAEVQRTDRKCKGA